MHCVTDYKQLCSGLGSISSKLYNMTKFTNRAPDPVLCAELPGKWITDVCHKALWNGTIFSVELKRDEENEVSHEPVEGEEGEIESVTEETMAPDKENVDSEEKKEADKCARFSGTLRCETSGEEGRLEIQVHGTVICASILWKAMPGDEKLHEGADSSSVRTPQFYNNLVMDSRDGIVRTMNHTGHAKLFMCRETEEVTKFVRSGRKIIDGTITMEVIAFSHIYIYTMHTHTHTHTHAYIYIWLCFLFIFLILP